MQRQNTLIDSIYVCVHAQARVISYSISMRLVIEAILMQRQNTLIDSIYVCVHAQARVISYSISMRLVIEANKFCMLLSCMHVIVSLDV